ncbi:MAG TPA: DUF1844 domain-containing protein [Thermoanaerobaculia bacterium]|nr:DUF1844 domain-containing protein [Thermoanaerobaculia bacterium]
MANEKKEIKVTDKRMFTSDGKLREEYRFLDEKSTAAPAAEPPAAPAPAPPPASPQAAPEARRPEPPRPAGPGPQVEMPPAMPPELGGPSFFDLVAMLAEAVPIYLGDARLPDGQSAENLEMARFHIDLMDVLRQKTLGNVTAEESAFLEDLLYRLRVRYVQKSR